MEQLNINTLLHREQEEALLKDTLVHFQKNKNDIRLNRGIYIYGIPGIGKTKFATQILENLGYSIIYYDTSTTRNKSIINEISKSKASDRNVLSMFKKQTKPIAIIMDEIDGMNCGDKGGITALIKLIRGKKTKKQKEELSTNIPVICIGNNHQDKKIRELMKVCTTIHLKLPKSHEIQSIVNLLMPNIDVAIKENVIQYINGDLRKLQSTYTIYKEQQHLLKQKILCNIFQSKIENEDTKHITRYLLNNNVEFKDHNLIINETDRTSVSLLFHENIVDAIVKNTNEDTQENGLNFYLDFLDNFNFCDYIDRITFQKQIWSFNEISSYIKNINNNNLYHDTFVDAKPIKKDIRFTKILTKYSTEYNNNVFIETLCSKLNLDADDLLSFFIHIRKNNTGHSYIEFFDSLEITKLDVQRMYRFIDNFIK